MDVFGCYSLLSGNKYWTQGGLHEVQKKFKPHWLGVYVDLHVILQCGFCRYFWTVTCVFYARCAGQVSFSFPFQRAVMHIRRTRSTSRVTWIILYFNSFYLKQNQRIFYLKQNQRIFQIILLIFYFEYPLKTWGNPFFATYRSFHKPKPMEQFGDSDLKFQKFTLKVEFFFLLVDLETSQSERHFFEI